MGLEGGREEHRISRKRISRKSIRWSAVPVPCLSRLRLKLRGEQGSGPEGVDDLCFHTYGEFSPSSYPPSASRAISQPGGPYPSLNAQIPTQRPRFHSLGIWALRLGFVPGGWDMGLDAEIWAWRLGGFGAEGGGDNSSCV